MFRWLTNKLDTFLVAGVKFETLESLYINTKNNIASDPDNSQNKIIITEVQKFMRTLNEKIEEFRYGDQPSSEESEDKDDIYNFNKPTKNPNQRETKQQIPQNPKQAQEIDIEMNSKAMKNNFMNIEEHDPESAKLAHKRPVEEPSEDDEEEEHLHPLKSKFMEAFDEIDRTSSKFQITQKLSFIRLILCDDSVKDPEQGFYLMYYEFTKIVIILSGIMKADEVNPLEVYETFDLLKPVRVQTQAQDAISKDIRAKVKIILKEFVPDMHDVAEIGHNEILNKFYKVLNSYTLDLKKAELSAILREVDFQENKLNKHSFRVHFQWFTTQILGQFFFLNDIEPCIPLLVTCLEDADNLEESSFKNEVANLFKQTFELFGYDTTKKFIEVYLLKDTKLYSIFFHWFYSQGFVDEKSRPKTTSADFYPSSPKKTKPPVHDDESDEADDEEQDKNDESDDEFPMDSNYKVIESRPKTSIGNLMVNEKKDVNFDLSPSQNDTKEKHSLLAKSNQELQSHRDEIDEFEKNSQKPLMQFLTEEKQFDTLGSNLDSKHNEAHL